MKLSGFLGLFLLACSAQPAQADISIAYQVTTEPFGPVGPVEECALVPDGLPATCLLTAVAPGMSMSVDATTAPGVGALSQTLNSTVNVTTSLSALGYWLTVWITAQDFVAPTTPPDVDFSSTFSTISTTGLGTTTLESCIDQANALGPPSGSAFCPVPAGTLVITQVYSGASSETENEDSLISALAAPYAVTQQILLELGPGSTLPVIASTSVAPVPEPGAIALLGTVVLLSVSTTRRKPKIKRNSHG